MHIANFYVSNLKQCIFAAGFYTFEQCASEDNGKAPETDILPLVPFVKILDQNLAFYN